MTILGIDPGYDRVGWAVIEKEKKTISFIACGLIQTKKAESPAYRLQEIYDQLVEIMLTHTPDYLSIESLFFFKNAKTVIGVSQARGVILLAAQKHGLTIQDFTPLQVKSTVTGDGSADKKTVERMIRLQLQGIPDQAVDDTIDAIATAFTAAVSLR